MTSSLASQLSKIQSLSASKLATPKSLTSQKSYLFPTRTASSQDLSTILSLAQNGWDELLLSTTHVPEHILHVGNQLFDSNTKGLDRTLLGKEENSHLDRTINQFLSFFNHAILDKSMAKCLEWFVRRYRIHEFNVETVLAAFLPYHETPQFARMLQILKLDDQPKFQFLLPLQKTGSTLPMSNLLAEFLSIQTNPNAVDLLAWISQLPSSLLSSISQLDAISISFPNLLNFWTSIMTQFLISSSTSSSLSNQNDLLNSNSTSTNQSRRNATSTKLQSQEQILNILLPNLISLNQISKRLVLKKSLRKAGGGSGAEKFHDEIFISTNFLISTLAISFPLSFEAVKGIVQTCFHHPDPVGNESQPQAHSQSQTKIKSNHLSQSIQSSLFNLLISLTSSIDPNSIAHPPLKPDQHQHQHPRGQEASRLFDLDSLKSILNNCFNGEKNLLNLVRTKGKSYHLIPFLRFFSDSILKQLSSSEVKFDRGQRFLIELMGFEEGAVGREGAAGEVSGIDQIQKDVVKVLLELDLNLDSDSDSDSGSEEIQAFRIAILARFRQRKGETFEEILKESLHGQREVDEQGDEKGVGEDSRKKEKLLNLVKKIIGSSTSSSKSKPHPNSTSKEGSEESPDFYLGIHDRSPSIRVSSLKSLFSSIEKQEINLKDGLVMDCIKARILDDDAQVLETLFANPQIVLDVLLEGSNGETVDKNQKKKSNKLSSSSSSAPSSDLEVLNLFLLATDPKMDLNRSGLKAHLKFLLGPFLNRVKKSDLKSHTDSNSTSISSPDSNLTIIESTVIKNLLFNKLIQTKSNKKTFEMIVDILKDSFEGLRDDQLGEFVLLKHLWQSKNQQLGLQQAGNQNGMTEKEKEETLAFRRNSDFVDAFARGLKSLEKKDRSRYKIWLDFLLSQSSNQNHPSMQKEIKRTRNHSLSHIHHWPEPNSNSKLLSLLTLIQIFGSQEDPEMDDHPEIHLKDSLDLLNGLDIESLSFESEKQFEEELVKFSSSIEKEQDGFSARIQSQLYSKTSSKRVSRILISFLLISILKNFQKNQNLSQISFLDFSTIQNQVLLSILSKFYQVSNRIHLNASLRRVVLSNLFLALGNKALNFLVRIWIDTSSDNLTKLASVSHALAFFKAFLPSELPSDRVQAKDFKIDFQTVIPSILILLNEREDSIRWKALDCLKVIRATLDQKADKVKVWEYDQVYGVDQSANLQYLETETVSKYLDMILDSQENFKYDSDYLAIMNGINLNVSKSDGRKLANLKHSIICYLLSHVSCFPLISGKVSILSCLSKVQDHSRLEILLPRIQMILSKSNKTAATPYSSQELTQLRNLDQNSQQKENYVASLLQSFDDSCRSTLEEKSTGAWNTFLECLSESDVIIQKHAALSLENGLFSSLEFEMRRDVFLHLVTTITDGSRRHSPELRRCITSLNADSLILVHVLAQLRSVFPDETSTAPVSSPPQKSKSETENSQSQASSAISSVLEGILHRSASTSPVSLEPNGILIGELFEIMLVGIKQAKNLSVNSANLISLTLKSLNSLLDKPILEKKSSEIISSLRIEFIENVIQISSATDPSNFQEALLLLSKIAVLNPEQVLNHVMMILTYITKDGLARDDSFNFNVMEKTLRSILPPLVKSIRNKSRGAGNDHLSLLLRSRDFILNFTNSVKKIPKYRRVTFFPILVEILGEKDFLSAVVMSLVDSNCFKISSQLMNRKKEDSFKNNLKKEDSIEKSLSLSLSIFRHFAIDVQLIALGQIWLEMKRIWESKDLEITEIQEKVFLSRLSGIDQHSSSSSSNLSDPKRQVFALLTFIDRVIKDDNFQRSLSIETRKRNSKEIIGQGLESLIRYSLEIASVDDSDISRASSATLENITSLSPISTLMRVVVNLVKSNDVKSQQNGFELMSSRVNQLDEEDRRVVSKSSSIIVDAALKVLKDEKAEEKFKISSIKSLEGLAVNLLESEHSNFSTALPFVISIVSNFKANVEIRKNCFNLIKILAIKLGPRLIPQIETLSNLSIETIETSLQDQDGIERVNQEILRNLALETLSGLFISVPLFMTSQLEPIFSMSCNPRLISETKVQSKESNRQNPLNSLSTTLIKNSESQEVFNSIFQTFDGMDKSSKSGLISLLDLLSKALKFTSRENINKVYKSVFRFILRVLDLRRLSLKDGNDSLTSKDLNEIENSTLKAFLKMVLKLNETTFRPLFLRIFDWSVLDLVEEKELEDSEAILNDLEISSRKLILYKVINFLMNGLNGLVSNYYSTLLDSTIELLNGFQTHKVSLTNSLQIELWNEMISSLKRSAVIDKDGGGFWNPTRLNKVLPDLINQLNLLSSSIPSISENELTPKISTTISSLGETVSDESSLKSINSNLLTKTRNSNSRIRIGAILSLTNLWNSLQEALLHLVPETTPFLAELLDDVDEEVVRVTKELVGEIEKVLGEPLDEYLQ